MLYKELADSVSSMIAHFHISEQRKAELHSLVDFVQQKVQSGQQINLLFVCTQNSRRSLLSQIWAQLASIYYGVAQVYCYSGGSTQTALYPKIAETLINQGFSVHKMVQSANPVYAVKYSENTLPIIAFSKLYNSPYNPESGFSAIMTCTQAEKACPFIPGAAHRISIPFEDPKIADLSADQTKVYAACSLQIAAQMFYVFSRIKK